MRGLCFYAISDEKQRTEEREKESQESEEWTE